MTFLQVTFVIVLATALAFAEPGEQATQQQRSSAETIQWPPPLSPVPGVQVPVPPDGGLQTVAPVMPAPAAGPGVGPQQEQESPSPADDTGKLVLLLVVAAVAGLSAWAIPRVASALRRVSWYEPKGPLMEVNAFDDEEADLSRMAPNSPVVKATIIREVPSPTIAAVRETLPAAGVIKPPPMAVPAEQFSADPAPVQATPLMASPEHLSTVSPAEVVPAATPIEPVPVPVPPPTAREKGPCTVEAIRETRFSHSHQSWGSFHRDALPRLLFYGGNKFCQFSADRLEAADEWFVIGDIHGDFYALHTIVSHIRRACPEFGIVFLGDLIDRGPHPIECLWYLLKIADDHPHRVLWLAGNHDVGVRFEESTGTFRSTVEPAEFVSDLNVVDSFSPLRRAFGREYIELSEGLPRAAVMPDGLLLTHGGFPHTDLQQEFAAITLGSERRRWLESDPVIRDFTHLRITKYPMRRPNRLSISCSYGYKDFESFKQAMKGYNVKRLVTGHQHEASGYNDHPDWARNGQEALTLTGFGFADAYDRRDAYLANYRRTLVAGRCRPNQLPEIVTIPVDERDLTAFFDAEIATMPRFAAT